MYRLSGFPSHLHCLAEYHTTVSKLYPHVQFGFKVSKLLGLPATCHAIIDDLGAPEEVVRNLMPRRFVTLTHRSKAVSDVCKCLVKQNQCGFNRLSDPLRFSGKLFLLNCQWLVSGVLSTSEAFESQQTLCMSAERSGNLLEARSTTQLTVLSRQRQHTSIMF